MKRANDPNHRLSSAWEATMRSIRHGGRLLVLAAVGGALGLAGCEVTNPGPVEDRFLNDPAARQGIINGIKRAYSNALAGGCNTPAIARETAGLTRELFPSGNPGTCGISTRAGLGDLPPDQTSGEWNFAQNTRWVAEDAIRRFQENQEGGGFSSSPFAAEALVWAGFANKFLGENWCRVVFDGGSAQPNAAAFERAVGHFTEAVDVAQNAGRQDLVYAAYAGRASARVGLGDWSGAVSDASQVPRDFEFVAEFADVSQDQYNTFFWMRGAQPYRTGSTWNTPYDEYYAETGDPRVAWSLHPNCDTADPDPDASPPLCFGDLARFDMRVPFHRQDKYLSNADPINVASGREMELIRAEALLVDGDWEAAMEIVNDLRADVGVGPWEPENLEEAWTAFRFERGIELWLEGRRMWDLRRWQEEGRPGQMQPLEDPSNPETALLSDRDLCFPIPESEIETNPNVSG